MGYPQCGQLTAMSLTGSLHSMHSMSIIRFLPCHIVNNKAPALPRYTGKQEPMLLILILFFHGKLALCDLRVGYHEKFSVSYRCAEHR